MENQPKLDGLLRNNVTVQEIIRHKVTRLVQRISPQEDKRKEKKEDDTGQER